MQLQISLDEVKSHFEHWRATRTKRGKIPDYLWDKVKSLLGRYTLTVITETLHINTKQMREHINFNDNINFVEISNHVPVTKPETNIPTAFVKSGNGYSIEVHRPNGNILKINEFPIESLNILITQFME